MLNLYQPKVEFCPIYVPKEKMVPHLRYNHDVDIVKFKGKFLASWNANEVPAEGVPGQYNFLAASDDFQGWTPPVKLFSAEQDCVNPVESDNQWQPAFINLNDETLFCAWCDMLSRKVFVSESADGFHWTNREVANAPAELAADETGFPTNHGFITSKGVLIFPCSLPCKSGKYLVGNTMYAALLLSFDNGKSWEWSSPVEAVTWSEIGAPPRWPGKQRVALWEPSVYERADGTLEMLIRNSTAQECPEYDPLMRSEDMLLHAESRDSGRTWTRCRPVEIETTYSRNLALGGVGGKDSILMVMNDWQVNLPRRIPFDRYNLALFLAPGGEADLMLPGPVVQPAGGYGFYPNGFVDGETLYLAYTYPATIMGTKVTPLPDYSEPFLLPRGGRQGLRFEGKAALFSHPEATLGLVLSETLAAAEELTIEFTFESRYRRCDANFPLFTLGGKRRDGAVIELEYDPELLTDRAVLKTVSGKRFDLGGAPEGKQLSFKLFWSAETLAVELNGVRVESKDRTLRKFAFGGLYAPPEWPRGSAMAEEVRLDLESVGVHS